MKINIIGKVEPEIKQCVKDSVREVLGYLKQPNNLEISVKFVNAKEIRELNNRTRNIDKVTDVLSYPSLKLRAGDIIATDCLHLCSFDGKNIYLGDCALCLEIAQKQAQENGVHLIDEIKKLITHSVLHLLGYDHIEDKDYAVMHKIEIDLLGDY